jgi:hypothetical protein
MAWKTLDSAPLMDGLRAVATEAPNTINPAPATVSHQAFTGAA